MGPLRAVGSVPFVDLRAVHNEITDELLDDLAELAASGAFANGPQVAEFEAAFAAFCGAAHCVGVASGLDALRLGLLAAGIGPGDEVILPANTFAATLEAVVQANAQPVLADVTDTDFNLDPPAVDAALTPRTSFLLPVHLYGQMADLVELEAIAERHGLSIIEDACQAHAATRDGRRAGAAGLAGAFSFYPTKNLGAMGDAGACVTNDEELASRVRALREHGQRRKYEHDLVGYTARLDTFQAAVLLRKLPYLAEWNEQRRSAARFYAHQLEGMGDLRLPQTPDGSEPVWHLYVIRTARPERLGAFLRERGVETGRHYPQPLHLAPAYAGLGYRPGEFPVAEWLASEVLSLPIYPGISEEQLTAVVSAIEEYFRRG